VDLLAEFFIDFFPDRDIGTPAAASLLVLKMFPASLDQLPEEYPFGEWLFGQAGIDTRVDPLENAWHGNDDGGLHGFEVLGELPCRACVGYGGAGSHWQIVAAGAFQHV